MKASIPRIKAERKPAKDYPSRGRMVQEICQLQTQNAKLQAALSRANAKIQYLESNSSRRGVRGEAHPLSIINEKIAREIYDRAWAGEKQLALAVEFKVTQSLVSSIKLGKAWGHIGSKAKTKRQMRIKLDGIG
mgnify:CR=1 FL=1